MEASFVLAIICFSIFLVLFVMFSVNYVRSQKSEEEQADYIEKMYADKNLVKMEYDIAFCEVNPDDCFSAMFGEDGRLIQMESDDGIEEIVGTFSGK